MPAGQLQTRCSHCSYTRSFSLELGGRYYRCPECQQGVLAVPRPSAEDASVWREEHETWIRDSATRLGVDPGLWKDWEQGRKAIPHHRHHDIVALLPETAELFGGDAEH